MDSEDLVMSTVVTQNINDEHVEDSCNKESNIKTLSVLRLWTLSCNKLNALYGGDAQKVRRVYEYLIKKKGKNASPSHSNENVSTEFDNPNRIVDNAGGVNLKSPLKVIGTVSTDVPSAIQNNGKDSHSDTEIDQSTSKSCTLLDTDMSSESGSDSSSDVNNHETESPVFIPNKDYLEKQNLIQSKHKLKCIDTSDDSVEIIDVTVKVKEKPDDMNTLEPPKKPPLIDITNSNQNDDTSYNEICMEEPSESQITGDKGNKCINIYLQLNSIIHDIYNNCSLLQHYPGWCDFIFPRVKCNNNWKLSISEISDYYIFQPYTIG